MASQDGRGLTRTATPRLKPRLSGELAAEVLEALDVAVYMTDVEGRLTYFNEAAAGLWGHRPMLGEDMIRGTWTLRWPDGAALLLVALREQRANWLVRSFAIGNPRARRSP